MSAEQSADVKFEIGHVLFIDIVGYSKLLINEQSEQIQTLREIVRGTEQFRLAEAEGKLAAFTDGRRRRARLSQQSGSASFVRAGNQPGAEKSSRTSSSDGNSQWPRQ